MTAGNRLRPFVAPAPPPSPTTHIQNLCLPAAPLYQPCSRQPGRGVSHPLTVDTSAGVVLDTQVNVLLDAKACHSTACSSQHNRVSNAQEHGTGRHAAWRHTRVVRARAVCDTAAVQCDVHTAKPSAASKPSPSPTHALTAARNQRKPGLLLDCTVRLLSHWSSHAAARTALLLGCCCAGCARVLHSVLTLRLSVLCSSTETQADAELLPCALLPEHHPARLHVAVRGEHARSCCKTVPGHEATGNS